MKQIAIIGPTASGKTSLSINIAHKTNSIILSLDSLSVYKEIEIASAKPTIKERDGIKHFGIDEVYLNQKYDVIEFLKTYEKAKTYALNNNKNLIIVGGTGFYLKILKDGISPGFEEDVLIKKPYIEIYDELFKKDELYMKNISSNDKYRIQKAYTIYKKSNQVPSQYFLNNPKVPIIKDLEVFEILWQRDELKQRIKLRTSQMLDEGLINEVIFLEQKYSREFNAMNSIGILETLEYLDGKLNLKQLEDKISLNTSKLAKRQVTFNKGQFKNNHTSNILSSLNSDIIKSF